MVKEWLNPLVDPLMVEATIHKSYLVLPDNDLRVNEVTLAGTVTSAKQQKKTHNQPCLRHVCVCVWVCGGVRTVQVRTIGIEDGVACDEASASVLGNLRPHQLCLVMSRFVLHNNNGTF